MYIFGSTFLILSIVFCCSASILLRHECRIREGRAPPPPAPGESSADRCLDSPPAGPFATGTCESHVSSFMYPSYLRARGGGGGGADARRWHGVSAAESASGRAGPSGVTTYSSSSISLTISRFRGTQPCTFSSVS